MSFEHEERKVSAQKSRFRWVEFRVCNVSNSSLHPTRMERINDGLEIPIFYPSYPCKVRKDGCVPNLTCRMDPPSLPLFQFQIPPETLESDAREKGRGPVETPLGMTVRIFVPRLLGQTGDSETDFLDAIWCRGEAMALADPGRGGEIRSIAFLSVTRRCLASTSRSCSRRASTVRPTIVALSGDSGGAVGPARRPIFRPATGGAGADTRPRFFSGRPLMVGLRRELPVTSLLEICILFLHVGCVAASWSCRPAVFGRAFPSFFFFPVFFISFFFFFFRLACGESSLRARQGRGEDPY